MLKIPPFNEISHRFSDPGAKFEELVEDVLRLKHPNVQRFSKGGKDGGIDLVVEENGVRLIFECKQITEDGDQPARRRWKEVRNNLNEHLSSPDGPTKGQSQYQPWYNSSKPIRAYTFCVSSHLKNLSQDDGLETDIRDFFETLAQRPHLAHLKGMEVSVRSWDDFRKTFEQNPPLAFRWFRGEVFPRGLLDLDSSYGSSTFRAYLTENSLPFYSRSTHLEHHPSPEGRERILGEDALLDELFDENGPIGYVLTGSGGFGKSRLALELGRRTSEREGFAVRVENLDPDRLDKFIETLNPKQRTLLVIDYVETEKHFDELIDVLNQRREDTSPFLRFVATCRTSYYLAVARFESKGIERVDLSPGGAKASDWLKGYREATIEHVLRAAGLPTSPEAIQRCANTPALAVFLAFLKAKGAVDPDLRDLLAVKDFGSWFHGKFKRSFPQREIDEHVALWMGLMPLPEPLPEGLQEAIDPEVFDCLVMDHWIEKDEDQVPTRWTTVHDVLADQTVLSFLDKRKRGVERDFIEKWLDFGREHNVLGSAFVALQRLADQEEIEDVNFVDVFKLQIENNPETWSYLRPNILGTPLLSAGGVLELMDDSSELWADVAEDHSLHRILGWRARKSQLDDEQGLSSDQQDQLLTWCKKAAPHVEGDNSLLVQGLRMAPEVFRDTALSWLNRHPEELQTHFLLVAWIEAELPFQDVESFVLSWATAFNHRLQCSFVLKSWLGAGGSCESVKGYVRQWLDKYGQTDAARFVLKSWLDAGGSFESVEGDVRRWLDEYGQTDAAPFVLKSWLDAGGAFESVEGDVRQWLDEYGKTDAAPFVLKSWLDAGGAFESVEGDVRQWLDEYGKTDAAPFVLKSWLDAGGAFESVEGDVRQWLDEYGKTDAAPFVLKSWLDAGGAFESVEGDVRQWLHEYGKTDAAGFVLPSWLDAGGAFESVEGDVRQWLDEYGQTEAAPFVLKSWLDAGGAFESVEGDVRQWLDEYGQTEAAHFVLKSWLDAGGHFDVVENAAIPWISRNRSSKDAVFVTKFLVKQEGLPVETVRDVLFWCQTFSTNEDAVWRFGGLGANLSHHELVQDVVQTAVDVLSPRLNNKERLDGRLARASMNAFFNTIRAIGPGKPQFNIDELFATWVRRDDSFPQQQFTPLWMQDEIWLFKLVDILRQEYLDLEGDKASVERFLSWVNTWNSENKAKLGPLMAYLRQTYPQTDIWDLVEIPRLRLVRAPRPDGTTDR